MVGPAGEVLVKQRTDVSGIEETQLLQPLRRKLRFNDSFKLPAHPLGEWDGNSTFSALQDLWRQHPLGNLAEHPLFDPAMDFEAGRNGGRELQQDVVKQWRADLQRVNHAHAVSHMEQV